MVKIHLPVSYPVENTGIFIKKAEPIGGGGFGQVFLGEKPDVKNLYAVKIFYPRAIERLEDESERKLAFEKFMQHFQEEIQIMIECKHSHVVPIEAFGILKDASGNVFPYNVTRYFERGSTEGKIYPVEAAVGMILQVCDVLTFLHSKGIIHRDIKPGNLLLDEEERVIVADLGVAKILTGTEIEGAYTRISSSGYTPPEQDEGTSLSPSTDIYAAAKTLYTLVTGKIHPHLEQITSLPLKYEEERKENLLTILKGATAPEPGERIYQTAEEFKKALMDWLKTKKSKSSIFKKKTKVEEQIKKKEPPEKPPLKEEIKKERRDIKDSPKEKKHEKGIRFRPVKTVVTVITMGLLAVVGYTQRHHLQNYYTIVMERLNRRSVDLQKAETHFRRGLDLFDQKNFKEARLELETAIRYDWKNPEYFAFLGWTCSEIGLWDQSMESWQKAVELAPDSIGYRINLGKAFSQLDRSSEAITEWKKILEIDSDHLEAIGLIEQEGRKIK